MTDDRLWYHTFANLSRTPALVHAVAGRHGGVSEGHLRSLNMGLLVGDRREAVLENRRRLAAALGIPADRLVKSKQVHGVETAVIDHAAVSMGVLGQGDAPLVADGLLTAEPDVYLFMTFADCVPVLLHDPVAGWVGLVHAGWKGTVDGAVREALLKAQVVYGSRPEDVQVGIGPSIGPCCYEVGEDVAEAARRALPAWPQLLVRRDGRLYLDLWQANARQLEALGVPAANVEVSGYCSSCRSDLFFSHRKEKGKTGRMGAVIGLRPRRERG